MLRLLIVLCLLASPVWAFDTEAYREDLRAQLAAGQAEFEREHAAEFQGLMTTTPGEDLYGRILCPECRKEGRKSKVYIEDMTSTAMNCGGGFYDENGYFQPVEDCNTVTTYYRCSRGHTFTTTR